MLREPDAGASAEDVKAAYDAALAEVQRLENVVDNCSSPDWKKNTSLLSRTQALAQRLLTRLSTTTTVTLIGEIDGKVATLNEKHQALAAVVTEVKAVAEGAQADTAKMASENVELRADVDFLNAGYFDLRKIVERIEHKQRSHSVIIYGVPRGDPYLALEKLFQEKQALWRNLDEAYFLGKKPGRRPLLATFAFISACNDCLAYSHTDSFTRRHPGVTMVRDRSDLRRTGMSRLATATPALKLKYPNIKVHNFYDYVELDGKRTDAIDFAASIVDLGGSSFDIDAACSKNVEYEVNLALFIRMGDVIIYGYKRIGLQYTGPDDELMDDSEDNADNRQVAGREGGAATHGAAASNGASRGTGGQKRTLNGFDGVSDGQVRVFNGVGRHQGSSRNLSMMGEIDDPYDVRGDSS